MNDKDLDRLIEATIARLTRPLAPVASRVTVAEMPIPTPAESADAIGYFLDRYGLSKISNHLPEWNEMIAELEKLDRARVWGNRYFKGGQGYAERMMAAEDNARKRLQQQRRPSARRTARHWSDR